MKNLCAFLIFNLFCLAIYAQTEINIDNGGNNNGPHIINAHPNTEPGVVIVTTKGVATAPRYINVTHLDPANNILWSYDYQVVGWAANARALSIKKSDNSYILTGYAMDQYGIKHLLVFKINLSGWLVFSQVFEDPSGYHSIGMDIVPDHSGNTYIGVGFRTSDMSISGDKETVYFAIDRVTGALTWIDRLNTSTYIEEFDMAANIIVIPGTDYFYITGSANTSISGVNSSAVLSLLIDVSGAVQWHRSFKNSNNPSDIDAGASSFFCPADDFIYNLSNSTDMGDPVVTVIDMSGVIQDARIITSPLLPEEVAGYQIIYDEYNDDIIILGRVNRLDFLGYIGNYPVRVIRMDRTSFGYIDDRILQIPSEHVQDDVAEFLNYNTYPGSVYFSIYTPNIGALDLGPTVDDLYIVTESNQVSMASYYNLAFLKLDYFLDGACNYVSEPAQAVPFSQEDFAGYNLFFTHLLNPIVMLNQDAIVPGVTYCFELDSPFQKKQNSESYINPGNEASVSVYPNPSNGHLTVVFSSPEPVRSIIAVYDLSGRVVWATTKNDEAGYKKIIDLTAMPKGIYILQVTTPEKTSQQKFTLQ